MVLIDPKPTNYMMTPENAIPVIPYTAEFSQVDLNGKETIKDMHLLQLISELEDIKDLEDVRPAL
jgi:TFIIF-interacting CTD phosphatase-like protein